MATIKFWAEGKREFFEFDRGDNKPIIGHVDEGIIKQHPEAYAAFKNPEVLEVVAPVEEVITPEPEVEEKKEEPLISKTHAPSIEFIPEVEEEK